MSQINVTPGSTTPVVTESGTGTGMVAGLVIAALIVILAIFAFARPTTTSPGSAPAASSAPGLNAPAVSGAPSLPSAAPRASSAP